MLLQVRRSVLIIIISNYKPWSISVAQASNWTYHLSEERLPFGSQSRLQRLSEILSCTYIYMALHRPIFIFYILSPYPHHPLLCSLFLFFPYLSLLSLSLYSFPISLFLHLTLSLSLKLFLSMQFKGRCSKLRIWSYHMRWRVNKLKYHCTPLPLTTTNLHTLFSSSMTCYWYHFCLCDRNVKNRNLNI